MTLGMTLRLRKKLGLLHVRLKQVKPRLPELY